MLGRYLSITPSAGPASDIAGVPRVHHYVRKPAGIPFAASILKLAFRLVAFREVREELEIWDHKIHRPRPVLLPHEKGIKALRRWYAQFYPAESTGADTLLRELEPTI
ncbi:hypothetical protein [Nocardia sp. NPDC020380]|uniref:hypothetical protein n=1 Tax=Nocardia sp. NPDC020380 TaxID=3364309 RepID=UPI00378E4A15